MLIISSHADVLEVERTPLAVRWSPSSTYEVIARAAAARPNAPALTLLMDGTAEGPSITYTYGVLADAIGRAANLFRSLGAASNAPVALLLPNLPQTHVALWGAQTAAAAAPINPLLEPAQIGSILRAIGAKVLVALAPLQGFDIYEKALAAIEQAPGVTHLLTVTIPGLVVQSGRPAAPHVQSGRPAAPQVSSSVEHRDFDDACASFPSACTAVPAVHDVAAYFQTGGTTAAPKVARHTHANETFDAWIVGELVGLNSQDVMLCGLPLFHVNAAIVTGLAPFAVGAHVVLATPLGYRSKAVMENFWHIIERWQVSMFSGVPTLFAALLAQHAPTRAPSRLRFAICGAAPMPVVLFEQFERKTGIRILEGYGLTEATCVSSVNPTAGECRIGSIGLRLPYQEMKIVVLDESGKLLRDAAANEVGVIALRGPNVFPGYLDAKSNETAWIEGGWLNTGDLGRQDDDGYFWLTARTKDLIIRGGHNIDPQLIEAALSQHPVVALAVAVGQPDSYAGELPAAYVVLRAGATVSADELLAYARERIAERAAVPVHIEIVENLPLTALGKVFKPELRRNAAERVLRNAVRAAGGRAESLRVVHDPQRGMHALIESEALRPAIASFAIAAFVDAIIHRHR